jgi:hypothetical protein
MFADGDKVENSGAGADVCPVVHGVRFGAAGTAGKFQRNLF